MNQLFEIRNEHLIPIQRTLLPNELLIENWVKQNPAIVGLDAIVIGSQVKTDYGTVLDLLALERNGNLVVIELKKDRTPRDIVAQALDYGSWIYQLTAEEIYKIAEEYFEGVLDDAYYDKWQSNIPETLNESHSLLIVAGEVDSVTQRIVEYLAIYHGININTAFFNIFEKDDKKWLTADMLLDQETTERRSTKRRNRLPWTGYYFTNVSLGDGAVWPDMMKHGFIGTNGGRKRVNQMENLKKGDEVFAYLNGRGYVGYGRVSIPLMSASQFATSDGMPFSQQNSSGNLMSIINDVNRPLFVVGVDWIKVFDEAAAKNFQGRFANQHIVCRLSDPTTLEFLEKEFKLNKANNQEEIIPDTIEN